MITLAGLPDACRISRANTQQMQRFMRQASYVLKITPSFDVIRSIMMLPVSIEPDIGTAAGLRDCVPRKEE
jgi:hypothetical protein